MTGALKTTFLIHAIVAVLFGALMLFIPGQFLVATDWAPIDRVIRVISRPLGAALLALAWSSFRGWRASEWSQVVILVEMEAVFAVLACVGLLRHLIFASYPISVWPALAISLLFAIAWIFFLLRGRARA